MGKLNGYLHLIRPLNCAMMGFGVFVGAVLAGPQLLATGWVNILFGFLTGFTLCGAAMTINDYYDRQIDSINEPQRPIPSGLIKEKEALVFVFVLSLIGFAFAYLTSIVCLIVAAFSMFITGTYLTIGKRTGLPGNFLVSACVAIPFLYGSITITGIVGSNVLLFASMAFLSNTGREITKGIVDVKGDSVGNVKTLAVRFGEGKAAVAASSFYLVAVLLTPVTWLLGLVSVWFIPFVIVTDLGLLTCSIILIKDHSREKARKIKNVVLFLFIFGLLAYIFGAF